MKCENCNLEGVLNKREAEKKMRSFNKIDKLKTATQISLICIGSLAFWCLIGFWTITAVESKGEFYIMIGVVNFIYLSYSLFWIVINYLVKGFGAKELVENRKEKFAKKFPDDAKYLE